MVKLEEVEDEHFAEQAAAAEDEGEWDTDDESDVSSVLSDEADHETLYERIVALKDVVPPAQRRRIGTVVSSTQEWGWWGLSKAAKASWVVGVSAMLLMIPFAVGMGEDQEIAMQEKQMSMQQSANDLMTQSNGGPQQPQQPV